MNTEIHFLGHQGRTPFFSFDILSSAFKYGNRCFTKYTEGMPDYFKQAFPAVMSYERTFTLEDEGVSTASGLIRYKSIVWYECRNTFKKKSSGSLFTRSRKRLFESITQW